VNTTPQVPAEVVGESRDGYEWLAANGIAEWIPYEPVFHVHDGQLTYTSYLWAEGRRGWDPEQFEWPDPGAEPPTELRTVPLLAPLTDAARASFRSAGARLVEQ
jgi:hypothetical protein